MSRECILVIDDSPTILKLVQLVLTEADYRVATAARAEQGLEVARAEHPQLILVDSLLPDMDGEAVCAALRADSDCASVPVVLMGTEAQPETETSPRGPRRNVVDSLAKPFTPEALLKVVAQALVQSATPPPAGPLAPARLAAPPGEKSSGSERNVGVALAGDLSAIALSDVLMLLEREGQTGVLSVASGEARLRLYLRKGRLDLATADGLAEEFLLGRFLVRAGALDTPTLLGGLEARRSWRTGNGPLPLLGRFLVDRGLVVAPDLTRVLALQTAALLFESLRWNEGRFAFEQTGDQPRPARDAALALPLPALLLEGFRRVEEWRLIQREIGDLERIFVRMEGKVADLGRGRLTEEETTVLDLTDGRRTVRQIVDASALGAWSAMRMLYRLLESGLVRPRVAPVAISEL